MYRPTVFNKNILKEISKLLIPRAKMRVSYNQTGMTKEEEEIYKQRSKLKASVFIPLLNYNEKACILYTQRTDKVSTHQNEISFPGGHADHKDQSVLHSALREFHEELGVHFKFSIDNQKVYNQFHTSTNNEDSDAIIQSQPFFSSSNEPGVNALELQILGTLFDTVPSKHGTSVQPIVGFVKLSKLHELKRSNILDLLNPDRNEVAKVFCVPVEELTNPHHQMEENLERRGSALRYRVPSSPAGDIWGLTGYLTQQLINHVLLEAFRNDLR
mmetsp:Transcript_36555/g.32244  ORF Transcript_36555/g.32244 Transcript_36555/m.32244 type:complete len:272 (+) Transcript_36555:27-842(+)